MKILETDRLLLRRLEPADAEFIFTLVNDPAWLRYIGDRGVRTLADAVNYIVQGPMQSYERHGFGLFLTALKSSGLPIGICGLLKRDTLPDVDLGFAFLPQFWGNGYALESAAAVLAWGKEKFQLQRVVAITTPDNHQSCKVLEKLNFKFEALIHLSAEGAEMKLFANNLLTFSSAHPSPT